MNLKIAVLAGDGIGPEIVTEASKVLEAVGAKYGHKMNFTDILMGGCSIDACGEPLTQEAIDTALAADAVLMGSIGGNTSTSPWYKLPPEKRPEAGLLKIRTTKEFSESTVSKILDLVENSSMKKSKSENFIAKFARYSGSDSIDWIKNLL